MSGLGYTASAGASLPNAATFAALSSGAAVGASQWVDAEGVQYTKGANGWAANGVIDAANLGVPTVAYYVSGSGDPHAPGTEEDPLSSLNDVVTRLGGGSRVPRQVYVTVLDSLSPYDAVLRLPCPSDDQHYMIVTGARTVLLTTTIGAITQWSQDATHNTVGTIAGAASIASYGGASKYAGKRFRITSGTYAGATGILGAVESGVNVLFVPAQAGIYTPGTVPLSASDTIEILADPPLVAETLAVDGLFLGLDGVTVGALGDAHGVQMQTAKLLVSHCRFLCGVDIGAGASLEAMSCAFDDTVRTYGRAGDGGSGELVLEGCHTQAIEIRKFGKALVADTVMRGALSIAHHGSVQIAASSFLFISSPGSGTAVTMGQRASIDAVGVLNGRGMTASPAVLALGDAASIAYGVKPYFGSIGGTAKLYAFDASTSGVAADLPAIFSQNTAHIAPRTY